MKTRRLGIDAELRNQVRQVRARLRSAADTLQGRHDTIVIGAGVGGLTAAKEILDAGKSVLVLEADGQIGGRARTADVAGAKVDLGCSWIHGPEANPFAAHARAGRDTFETEDGGLFVQTASGTREATEAEVASLEETQQQFEANAEALSASGQDLAASQALPQNAPFAGFTASYSGELEAARSLERVSVRDVAGFNSGDADFTVRGGLGNVVQEFGKDVPVQLSTPVRKIQRTPGGYTVTALQDGKEVKHRSKTLVLTVSTGVLASGAIEFVPPLPKKVQEAIAGVPMGQMEKIIFAFDSDVFGDTPDNAWSNHAAIDGQPREDDVGVFIKPEGENVAVVFVGGEVAQQLDAEGQNAAVQFGLEKLKGMYGDELAEHVQQSFATGWSHNPLTRGSYSAALPSQGHQREVLQQPFRDMRLAGEAATSHELNGSVGGAHASGKSAAQDVLEILEQRERQGRMDVADALYSFAKAAEKAIRLITVRDSRSAPAAQGT